MPHDASPQALYCSRECAKAAQREQMRKWRESHRDYIRETSAATRRWYKLRGICVRCYRRDAMTGHTLCEECIQKDRARRNEQLKKAARGNAKRQQKKINHTNDITTASEMKAWLKSEAAKLPEF